MTFDEFVARATGNAEHQPYDYQRRLADEGLPELLEAPTGAGKTAAVVLAWLWRRCLHPDPEIRQSTPRRLAFALPMRVLVEQTGRVVREWLTNVRELDVEVHALMGGLDDRDAQRTRDRWRDHPEQSAVIVGTIDMLLSRALNRGYGESRYAWPVSFGLLNNDTQWVFDEIQLMGPSLPTSRQLEGLRRVLGTGAPCSSTWMSATVDEEALATVDNREVGTTVSLTDSDVRGPLRERLDAGKRVERLEVPAGRGKDGFERALAHAVLDAHVRDGRSGHRTIVVVNTVERAQRVYQQLQARDGSASNDISTVLVHSRFRPRERAAKLRAVEEAPADAGTIVVSTQVIEAGVDLTSAVLITEAAPWSSIVQRAGRCNRYGNDEDARFLWIPVKDPAPYDTDDVEAASRALDALEGQVVSPRSVGDIDVGSAPKVWPVLRRRDLIGLFDTTPDLAGNDIDIGRYIRADDGLDVLVAWRGRMSDTAATGRIRLEPPPGRDEFCPVSITKLRNWLKPEGRRAWTFDHLRGDWRQLNRGDVRPGMRIVLPAEDGAYDTELGWTGAPGAAVEEVVPPDLPEAASDALDEAVGDDPTTSTPGRWIALRQHLEETDEAAVALVHALTLSGFTQAQRDAVVVAARLHDLGKAHPCFQEALLELADDEERSSLADGVPWAKSGSSRRLRHRKRRHFRHELVTALLLLGPGKDLLVGVHEWQLAIYLAAAHHGKVRLSIRALPGEEAAETGAFGALGVRDGDEIPRIDAPGGIVPASTIDLSPALLSGGASGISWTNMAVGLRDRADLGPFRLAYLEALVRVADWRASATGGPDA